MKRIRHIVREVAVPIGLLALFLAVPMYAVAVIQG